MAKRNTRQNRITLFLLFLVFIGAFMRKTLTFHGIVNVIYGIAQTSLWCCLIITWCILVRHRLIQRGIRSYLTAMCVCMVLWFLFRGLKYYIFLPETTGARYCWYAYYIPMMFYPACAVCAMTFIGKREDWKLPKCVYAIFLPSVVIGLLVLTNDWHQQVFTFPDDAAVWSDVNYGYGLFYVLPFAFFVICTLASLIIMIKRCRISQTHRFYSKLPLVPPILGLGYSIAYIRGQTDFFSDLIITMCFLTIVTFESSIRLGYIRSNTNYPEIFQKSSIAAQIFDKDLKLRYVSGSFFAYEDEILQNTLRQGEYRQGNVHYLSGRISGGYVIWKEDVTELIRLQKELKSANAYLEDQNMVQRKNYDSKIQRRKLEEQNRLYNEMQNQTKEKLEKFDKILAEFQSSSGDKERKDLLRIGILTAYLKRRNNLIFLVNDDRKIPATELRNCMKETAKMLGIFGITCVIQPEMKMSMTFRQVVALYDAFEMVVEETAFAYPVYFTTVAKERQGYVLRVRISEMETIPDKLSTLFEVVEQEEGEYLLEKKIVGEEELYEKA